MIPKARLVNILACFMLLAKATPLPLGITAHSDVPNTVVNATNQPNKVSGLYSTSASSDFEAPFDTLDTLLENLARRGTDDAASGSSSKQEKADRKRDQMRQASQRYRDRKKRNRQLAEQDAHRHVFELSVHEATSPTSTIKDGEQQRSQSMQRQALQHAAPSEQDREDCYRRAIAQAMMEMDLEHNTGASSSNPNLPRPIDALEQGQLGHWDSTMNPMNMHCDQGAFWSGVGYSDVPGTLGNWDSTTESMHLDPKHEVHKRT
ncbi:hypothetical protein H0H93_001112 [Arthromyces matolae]|nr:hypothetical protein H0H93_001112 [Arthromyces matolae]